MNSKLYTSPPTQIIQDYVMALEIETHPPPQKKRKKRTKQKPHQRNPTSYEIYTKG